VAVEAARQITGGDRGFLVPSPLTRRSRIPPTAWGRNEWARCVANAHERRTIMGLLVINTHKERELDPGQTLHSWWNNASPTNAVWSANAVALATGSTNTGFNQDTQLEVTRLWRRFKVTEKSSTQFSDTDIETEIHYEVKNIGGSKARFIVYLCVAW
jgi:hypothetical protein